MTHQPTTSEAPVNLDDYYTPDSALRGSGEPGTSYTEIKAQLERLIEKNENQANIISDLRANYSDAISERNAAEDLVKSLKKEHAVSMFDQISSMTKERDAQAEQIKAQAEQIDFLTCHVNKQIADTSSVLEFLRSNMRGR